MKILVTGGSGFVGRHLVRDLTGAGHTVLSVGDVPHPDAKGVASALCDITDASGLKRICSDYRPDGVVHLAGMAHVVSAEKDPERLMRVNVGGTEHIAAAIAAIADKSIPVILASSIFVYGTQLKGDIRLDELRPVAPDTAYGRSKFAAEQVLNAFASPSKLKAYAVRPFNHIGPGQSTAFVCSAFADRIARTPAGGTIEVGNLNARRDFSDVRDIVRAYRLILEKQPQDGVFVLGSGAVRPIQDLLDELINASGKAIRTSVSADLLRAQDEGSICANTARASQELGWRCSIPFETTIRDVYADAKQNHAK